MPPRRKKTTGPNVPEPVMTPVTDLTLHPDNPRRGDVAAITDSMRHHGFFGALVAQRSTGHVLAGNHRLQAAIALGIPHVPVTYLDIDDDQAKRILLIDNRTNDLATYDHPTLIELLQSFEDLTGTGYTADDLDDLLDDLNPPDPPREDDYYTQDIISPIYEPTGPEPAPADLFDRSKTHELQQAITATPELPDELRAFLMHAAERHTVFHFDRIANYYAHAPQAIQDLMEQSALVIIDYHRAIELGFTQLNAEIMDAFREDHPDA